jgi:WD40 repeat protein
MWPAYNNFARGSVSGSIKVYDLRIPDQEAVVWKATHAHAGGIRDLQWSPFIPYWFATAGEDARIKVWDLRYQKSSLIELNDHSSAVNSV